MTNKKQVTAIWTDVTVEVDVDSVFIYDTHHTCDANAVEFDVAAWQDIKDAVDGMIAERVLKKPENMAKEDTAKTVKVIAEPNVMSNAIPETFTLDGEPFFIMRNGEDIVAIDDYIKDSYIKQ